VPPALQQTLEAIRFLHAAVFQHRLVPPQTLCAAPVNIHTLIHHWNILDRSAADSACDLAAVVCRCMLLSLLVGLCALVFQICHQHTSELLMWRHYTTFRRTNNSLFGEKTASGDASADARCRMLGVGWRMLLRQLSLSPNLRISASPAGLGEGMPNLFASSAHPCASRVSMFMTSSWL